MKVLSMFLAIFFVVEAKANPVDMATVREVGTRFLKANTKLKVDNTSDLRLVATYRSDDGVELFHVFNTHKGFVIVAADDCARPILGYSDEGPFDLDNLPVQMQGYLQGFVEQIQYGVENHLVADETIAREWELVKTTGRVKEERGTTAVQPLLTDTWNQNCYYNNKCPQDPNGPCGHVYAGCVATSCSQIMHYWGYPATGTGSHTYTPTGYPQQTANFGATTYDWDNMPNSLTSASNQTQIDAVATLIWHCSVAVNMAYGPNGSSASSSNLPSVLVNYFNYSSDLSMVYRNSYSSEDWLTMMKDCLDLGRPIHYRGTDEGDGGGHAFVCDGYDTNDFLHFNWGWGGYGNNYFADGALNPPNGYAFNITNAAIINIHPDCDQGTSYQVTATGNPTYGGIVTGSGSYNCGSGCTLTAIPYSEYTFCSWMEDGVVVSTDPTYSFTVMGDRNLVANFVQSGGNDCTLVFTLNDSYGDGWNGNALTVSYSTGCLVNERLTIASGGSAIFTRNVVDGSHIILGWVMGSWVSQCSFTVSYENGTVIYQSANLSSGLFYEFDVDCGGNTPPKPLSNVVVEYYPDTSDPFGQYVKVSWDGPINETSYQIYRAKCNGLGEELIADNVTGNEYIDYGWDALAYGNYMYGVSAVDDRGVAGEIKWNASTTVADAVLLEPLDIDMVLESQPVDEPVNAIMDREAWLSYDNGTLKTNIGYSTSSTWTWACMYPASMLNGNNVLTKISIRENSYMTNDITVEIYTGGTEAPVSLVGTHTVTPVGNSFHEITLPEPVAIDPTKNLWIVLTTNGTYIIPACENTISDNQWIRSNGNWRHIGDIAPTMSGYGWMIRGYVEKIVPIVWSNCIEKEEIVVYYDIAATANPTEGGTVSGGGSYVSGASCTLTATANEGYSFTNWTKDGEEVSTNAVYTFTVTENATYVANFMENGITQTTNFTSGWTWWSTYIEQSELNGLTMLENELGTDGLTIKSQNQFVNYNPNTNKWTGSLKSINNEGAFMIRVGTACEVSLTGAPVNPADHPITLNPGWTWIGYPVTETMSVTEAFANITPSVGDQVKSQSGFATYNGTKWSGSLKNMEPGKGYMYKSNNAEAVILVYP